MKIQYFQQADTFYIEFSPNNIVETRQLHDNIILDLDETINLWTLTLEHAQEKTDIHNFSFEQNVGYTKLDTLTLHTTLDRDKF